MKRVQLSTLSLLLALAAPSVLAQARPALPAVTVEPAPAPTARRIERLQITGNQVLPTPLLEAVAAPWLGKALDEAELEDLRQALTRAYIERGFVNSGVLLEAQQDAPGVLRLRAVEGRLVGVQLRGLQGLSPTYLQARLQQGGVLNMELLREQFQLLLNDPLFRRVQARLLPGEVAGEAVLDVEVERARPWQLSSFVNNYRPVSVGEWALGLRGQVSNLSGQGDHLDASLQIPLQHSRGAQQGATSLAWRLPLGAMALPRTQWLIGAEQSDAAVVEQPVRQLGIESRVRSVDTGFAHTLWETPAERAGLGLQLQWRQQQSWLLGEPFSFTPGSADGRVRERVLRFWQEAQWRSTQQLVALRSTLSLGRSNVQDQLLLPGVDPGPAPNFLFWTGQAQWLRPVGDAGTQLSLRLNAQWARDRMLAIDGLSAGGVRSVRGHRENALVRDEGAVASIELEHPLRLQAERWQGLSLNLLAFYEHARLRNRGQAWATLASVGLGVQASWRDWQLELSAAHRLQSADSAPKGSALQDQGVHLQINRKW